jgi:hypothetical protein
MTKKLTHLVIDRVDLVDRGANPDAHITLAKREEQDPSGTRARTEPSADLSVDKSDPSTGGERMSDEQKDDVQKHTELEEKLEAETKARADAEAKIAELEGELAEAKKSAEASDESEDEVMKSLPEDVRKRIEDAEARAQEAERIAKAERETRLDGEYVAKAGKLDKLSLEADKFGPMLRKVAEQDAETAAEIERVLTAANESLSKSELFKSIGDGSAVVGDAEAKLDAMAKKYADDHKVSYAKAYDTVIQTDEGRALYGQSREEVK